ncbi:MAG TPA: pilus assembly protein N-terminal domain-containing protein [Polyangiaceae bacterium]|nr:pilus assembly protein N-terminal domain-containing protein [Polyangiaceae bacterium]
MRRLKPSVVSLVALAVALAAPYAEAQRGRGGGGSAATATPAGTESEHVEELGLAVGETKTINAREVRNYSVADPAIIDARVSPDGGTFLVVGRKAGSTTLVLIKNDGSQVTWVINVSTRPPEVVYRELQQLLEGTTGVRVRRVGGRFFLEGGVTTEQELKRVGLIAALYPGQVENLVQVGSGSGDRRILIRVDFFFVEYDKNSSYAVGIGYPLAIGGDQIGAFAGAYNFLPGSITSATATLTNQPLPRLDFAANNGWAKVLKQSSIITSNGQEALFNSGGEVNFRQFAFNSASGMQKITFGTNVTVLPRYDSTTREVELRLVADESELTDASVGGGDLPGRNTNKLEALVNMKLGQALILSGIKSVVQSHSVAGLPLLSQIPVLGIFFGSHSNRRTETENAMFIIPSVVETVPKSSLDLVRNALDTFDDYNGNIDDVKTFDRTPPSAKKEP